MKQRPDADLPSAAALYKATKEEYAYKGGIFDTDDQKVARTKWIIDNRLEEAERIIIRLYCELQSMAKVAKLLGIGRSTAAKEIARIRTKVLKEYYDLENDLPDGGDRLRN